MKIGFFEFAGYFFSVVIILSFIVFKITWPIKMKRLRQKATKEVDDFFKENMY